MLRHRGDHLLEHVFGHLCLGLIIGVNERTRSLVRRFVHTRAGHPTDKIVVVYFSFRIGLVRVDLVVLDQMRYGAVRRSSLV
jgi:hypothetical protein